MAKFSVAGAVLFCFFTIALTLTPLKTPENEDLTTALSLPDPVSGVDRIVSLSSEPVNADEITNSQPAMTSTNLLELMPLVAAEDGEFAAMVSLSVPEVNLVKHYPSESVNSDDNPLVKRTFTSSVATVPLTVDRIRPINRRFSKFPCHHHRHKRSFFKGEPTEHVEINYGNDMLVASGENSDFQDLETLHGGTGQRVKLHFHHDDSDSDDDEDHHDQIKKKLKKLRMHFHRQNIEEERHHQEKSGFFRRVRKFLGNYV